MRIAATILCLAVATGCAEQQLDLSVLSGPSEMVTGGDALVEVSGAGDSSLQVELNGRDVASSFRGGLDLSRLVGRVSELKVGKNTLTAKVGEQTARTRFSLWMARRCPAWRLKEHLTVCGTPQLDYVWPLSLMIEHRAAVLN